MSYLNTSLLGLGINLSNALSLLNGNAQPLPISENDSDKVNLPEIPARLQLSLLTGSIVDLTAEAAKRPPIQCYGRFDDVVWIANRMLCSQNNSVLVTGSPGIGKTILIDYIADLILKNNAPIGLKGKRLILIKDFSVGIIKTLANPEYKNCIFVVDELHSYISPEEESSFRYSEELKTYIGSNKINLIGFTDRPRRFIGDIAWKRRFYLRHLSELSTEKAVEAIYSNIVIIQQHYSAIFKVLGNNSSLKILKCAIETAVKLSQKYFPDEFLPDKAFKILDPACAYTIQKASQSGQLNSSKQMIKAQDIINYLVAERQLPNESEILASIKEIDKSLKSCPIPSSEPLARYTKNFTLLAGQGAIPPVHNREIEIDNIIGTLCGTESNNIILRGPQGCGKTRIAEGLAYRIVDKKVPLALQGMQVLFLELSKFLSDTGQRGQLETKIYEFLDSAERYEGHFILVIDEIHRIIGAGRSEGTNYNAADEFKTLLARGMLPTVGMTTNHEYHYLECDPAFLRRFITQDVYPFTPSQTIDALNKDKAHLQLQYEKKAHCTFVLDKTAFIAATYLAKIHLKTEFLPSSAYKLMHGSCGRKISKIYSQNEEIRVTEDDVIEYVDHFFVKPSNPDPNSQSNIKKMLRHLEAEALQMPSIFDKPLKFFRWLKKLTGTLSNIDSIFNKCLAFIRAFQ